MSNKYQEICDIKRLKKIHCDFRDSELMTLPMDPFDIGDKVLVIYQYLKWNLILTFWLILNL